MGFRDQAAGFIPRQSYEPRVLPEVRLRVPGGVPAGVPGGFARSHPCARIAL